MKKYFLTAAMAFVMSNAAMAQEAKNESVNNETQNIEFAYKINRASAYLNLALDEEQKDQMNAIFAQMNGEMRRLKRVKEEKRAQRLHEALVYHLSAAQKCLTDVQYRKYLRMLNQEMNESGLDYYFVQYALSMAE